VKHQGVHYDTGTMFRGPGYGSALRRCKRSVTSSCSRSGLAGSVGGNLPDVAVWISEAADPPEFVDV
jgi:hypothetical protein